MRSTRLLAQNGRYRCQNGGVPLIARSPSGLTGSSLVRVLGKSRARLNQPASLCTVCAACANRWRRAGWVSSRDSSEVVAASSDTSCSGRSFDRSTTPRGSDTAERNGKRRV
ncbi:hypothetical protein D3C72_1469800 [compost metagenome]